MVLAISGLVSASPCRINGALMLATPQGDAVPEER